MCPDCGKPLADNLDGLNNMGAAQCEIPVIVGGFGCVVIVKMKDPITDMLENPGRPSYSEIAHELCQLKFTSNQLQAENERLREANTRLRKDNDILGESVVMWAKKLADEITEHKATLTRELLLSQAISS